MLVLKRLAVWHCATEDEFDWLVEQMEQDDNGECLHYSTSAYKHCWVVRRQPMVGPTFPIQWKPFFSKGKMIIVTRY
jgi:hypothetical protein